MKAPITSSRFRLGICIPLICGFMCLFLGTDVFAGDPDDDWGLPTVTDDGGDGSGSGSSESTSDIHIGSEVIESDPLDHIGLLVVDHAGDDSTGFVQGVAPAEAEIAPVETGTPVLVQSLDDGLAIQGRLFLNLPYNGVGSLKASIKSPVDAVEVRALLTIDNLDTIDELLADPSGLPLGVSTVLSVGKVATVNLNALKKLVDSCGDQIDGSHVSVVVLSTDAKGKLHVSAARISSTGGQMEVVTR